MTTDRQYAVYDDRACGDQGTAEASMLVFSGTLEAAREDSKEYGACAVYSYATNDGKELTDERWEFDVFPKRSRKAGRR